MGEDVGRKGGVYGVTQKLQARFGPDRVIDTLLDEQSILGLGIGMAHNGFLPIPEIQFLAYLHNAEDQLRGEAATLPFFSNGQFTNPMVVRIAGLGYQKGFGGHFHNDNSLSVLRDIPGLILACPSTGPMPR
jgi:2-oxoisovalerate dehydrogenase E1 component